MQDKHGSTGSSQVAALQAVLITINENAKAPVETLLNMVAKSVPKTSQAPKKKARVS